MLLQTILLPDIHFCETEELYFHRTGNRMEFNGYFNLFYIAKRKEYTALKSLTLRLTARGYDKIHLMHDRTVFRTENLCEGGEENHEFEFPYAEKREGVFWFSLEECRYGGEKYLKGYFEGEAEQIRSVGIAAVICTYRREDYVLKNLKSIGETVFEVDAEVSKHLHVFVVDNGRTLNSYGEIKRLVGESCKRISILENKNTGGAGGFTRGMLAAIEKKEALGLTHILLADDDAVLNPDLFLRLYGVLSTLREEFEDLTVGGTLLREDFPYIMQASGEWFENFAVHNDNLLTDLRDYKNCTDAFMCGTRQEHTLYSGWWCCCYSLGTVCADNLPIPLFLHHDDIEYGIRNARTGILFLNGVGVWHKGFENSFAGSNYYYDVRNTLITTALHENTRSRIEVFKWIWKRITAAVIEFRYAEAELAYRGLVDFCRGPAWLYSLDADALNAELRKKTELKPLSGLCEELSEKEFLQVEEQAGKYQKDFCMENIRAYYLPGRRRGSMFEKATFNGWLLPADRKPLMVVSALDSPFLAFRKKKIVLFEPSTGKGRVAGRDYREFVKTIGLYIKAGMLIWQGYPRAAQKYRERLKEITDMKAWRRYLDLKKNEEN